MSWEQFLRWCATPGAVTVIVGAVLSFAVDYWPAYNRMEAKWKRLVFGGLCLVIPLLSATAAAISGIMPWAWEPTYWQAIVAGFSAFTSGTVAATRKL